MALSSEVRSHRFGACLTKGSLLDRPTFDGPQLQMLECDVAESMLKSFSTDFYNDCYNIMGPVLPNSLQFNNIGGKVHKHCPFRS